MNMAGHELVVGAHVLSEVPENHENVVDLLWAQTTHALVLVELGNDAGFNTIMQARDRLLKHHRDAVLVAPCPHAHKCPLVGTPTPCHSPMRIEVPPSQHLSAFTLRQGHLSEKLAYLIVARPAAMEKFGGIEDLAAPWPRIIANPLQRRRHIVFSTCTPQVGSRLKALHFE
jgi:ribosomal protein RSM22 (predicted rRNA methylase)